MLILSHTRPNNLKLISADYTFLIGLAVVQNKTAGVCQKRRDKVSKVR